MITRNVTTDLFRSYALLEPDDRVLLLSSDDPVLAGWVVDGVGPAGGVIALHASCRALARLSEVPGLALSESVYPDPAAHGPADVALLEIPKGRDSVRSYLWTAAQALRPGGRLYLAGSNAVGARSAIKDAAAVFGSAPVLGYKSGHRIALATRSEESLRVPPDWGQTAPWQPQMRGFLGPDGTYSIVTMPGVFSWDHLDDGTALFLDHLDVAPGAEVLDIGCGYGIIGLVMARAGARVTMIDDDLLAVRCAQASVRANDLADHCVVLASDVTGAVRDRRFDVVVSNPPFHHGVEVTTEIAEQIVCESFDLLVPGGRLLIVANRFLPYDRTMREVFGNVRTLTETGRYYVLESTRED